MLDLHSLRESLNSIGISPLFVTVSGAHLYGFPSPDSDLDLRGAHILALAEVVGLHLPTETLEKDYMLQGQEVELVSHEVGKYLRLLVKNNGYVLEQIFSPLVVVGQEFLGELRGIARRCITKHHYHHYRGFLATKRKLLEKQKAKEVKSLLYAYRVLLTGMHLLRTGEVQSHLPTLAGEYRLDFVDDLIRLKTQEKITDKALDWPWHQAQLDRLDQAMARAYEQSPLPENRDYEAANQLLVRLRLDSR